MVYLYAIAEPLLEAPGVSGLDGAPLRVVTADGLAAVISDRDGHVAEGSEAELWAHEAVVEQVMGQRTVLPMRFGSTLPDDGSVRALLAESREAFLAALDRVRGAVEVGLHAACEFAAVDRDGSGTAYLMGRLDRDRRARALAARIDGPLEELARASDLRILPAPGALLRCAYLIDIERLEAFRTRVDQLDREIGEAEIVCTGPWPPYSFASLGGES